MTTKNDILSALQREPLTVVQLCERLGLTRNAINVQLKQLEAEGRVRRRKVLQTGLPGKPAALFEAAPGSEDSASSAYRVFLLGLLGVLGERLSGKELESLMEETGRRMAREGGLAPSADFAADLARAMGAADSLGASTEAVPVEDGVMVRNYSCPLGGATRSEPCVCKALAAFFSEATGNPVTECCLREDRLICQYLVQVKQERKGATRRKRGA
ncbi:helix-turn-helix transcriptional regulator [Burkholderia gladioli]|uniref:helix-turn-helix transcriptional regulator n=1 Tax=Burkholderia gladioli TaxID=28095 RepID=UPI001640F8A7|nr:MarR family transcriptional regulator [Burkholderia gladioli]